MAIPWIRRNRENAADSLSMLAEQSPFARPAILCLAVVGAVKLLFFLLDPQPKFFQGDSFSYLYTAVTGWIPSDRSFAYGFIIRWLTKCAHSLTPLIAGQCLASLGTCWLVFHISRAHFGLSAKLAIAAACCCALDPLQLYYERAVMTEAFGTFFFALCMAVALQYMVRPRLRTLLFLTLLSMAPVSLRVNFILPAVGICLLPPLYLAVKHALFCPVGEALSPQSCADRKFWKASWFRYAGHFGAACACVFALHETYRYKVGHPGYPAYIPHEGFSISSA